MIHLIFLCPAQQFTGHPPALVVYPQLVLNPTELVIPPSETALLCQPASRWYRAIQERALPRGGKILLIDGTGSERMCLCLEWPCGGAGWPREAQHLLRPLGQVAVF